MLNGLE